MLNGLSTKEDIRHEWEEFLGSQTSKSAVGSERIFYWLFNQFGIPNSSPIGSDLFFETYNAYIHIDVKTDKKTNIGDFNGEVTIQNNQTSYDKRKEEFINDLKDFIKEFEETYESDEFMRYYDD